MTTAVNGLEELKALAGQDLGHTDWLQIDQGRVDTFADATDDHQWIHTDPERAATGPFGTTIAHGYLTLALLIPLMSELLEVSGVRMSINYGLEKVRFPAPVPVGAKIRLQGQVAAVEEVKGDGVQITIDFTVQIEGSDKPACVARGIYRHYA
ncbi:enoyl-CoA hydratase [Lentzea aerocolonigenes]|uniref:Enoyl-CoA hydratase n=1 Tax=Lentzea aerocolonigenes TaxID=68170 RepID=A0A0F0GD20_LENAE|nr:MaoC family dehydratase [Lentzea aerocolonigenes]KJK34990.1 enoyl-CoA hydratase [Lentzea aerocolonigenes]